MKKIIALTLAVLMLVSLAACGGSGSGKYTVGICQLVQHPALDAATQGFQDALTKALGEDKVTFDVQNASGEPTNCTTIVNKFVSSKVDLIMANATTALQAAVEATKDIPVLGNVLSGHCLLTYLAFLLVLVTWVLLYKTPLGLNIRSVGENPNAASSVGVSVLKIKYIPIGFSGAMAGFGGAFMSMYYAMGWSQDMVAGRGFIALAAQAMGAGEPLGAMLAAMVFGFAQALGIKISSTGVDSNLVSPIPYVMTILGLVVFALAARWKVKRQHSAAALQEKG